MKRSTERRFFIGVVLLLLILLSSPVLLFLLIGYGPKVSCRLANLARSDVASEAVAKVLVSGPGTLDFRSLAGEYDRVCLMDGEYDLDPEYESVPHWRKPGAPLATRIGRRICGGWQENSAVFALIKPGSEGDIYALLFHHFEPLPLEALLLKLPQAACRQAKQWFTASSGAMTDQAGTLATVSGPACLRLLSEMVEQASKTLTVKIEGRGSFSAWTDQTARSLGRDGIVAKIKVKPGDSLNVDAVILEFK